MAISKLKLRSVKERALKLYGTDLTEEAKKGKLDPVIGRDKEIEQLTEALLNRRKSYACLVGEAGVGKTAIVEGLAIQIAQGSAPPKLIGKRIISLDVKGLRAGTTVRGMLEERIKNVLDEVQRSEGSVILFIDELHDIMHNSNNNSTADNLKPALAQGDFMCIGATTLEEYTSIENDAALKRRFQTIHVLEPSRDASIEILNGLVSKYQSHHRVNYTKMALVAAVDLSIRYIRERGLFLPDKAIDLIDKAGARAQCLGKIYITEADIEHVVSTSTGIPVNKVSSEESERLLHLENKLKCSLIGQDEAVAAVCRALCRARVGLRDETKPIGCFLFTGPTGVGKTEMAKVVAREYFGSEEAMVRLDMSEFTEQHSVTRLIGSSPGYINHSEGGQLTEAVRRRPHSLVLFDEIEKAHEEILNLLLQILDDGRLSDGKGKTVDFTNTIVIVTSNVGSNSLELKDDSKRVFKAELLNRFDRVVVFESLKKEHIENILEIFIEKLRASVAAKKKIQVDVSDRLKARLVAEGYDERYGARALKRAVTSLVEDKLAEEVLNGTVAQYDTIMMDVSLTGEVVCRTVSQVKIGPTRLNSDSDASKHSKSRIVRACCVFGGHEFGCQPTNLDVSDGIAQVFDCT